MNLAVSPVALEGILPYRDQYRQELGCQIVHDSAHYRENCFQSYLLESAGAVVGYGSVWTGTYWMEAGSLFEFYVLPGWRSRLFTVFEAFFREIRPPRIHAQTNDPFLGTVLFDYTQAVVARSILFRAGTATHHVVERVDFRRATEADKDRIFKHHVEPVGDWVLEKDGRIVATGGVLFHYNRPYGDIFMEVDAEFRRRGYGQFLVQELKKACYRSGSIPAARCNPANTASRRTLERAGFVPCGRLLYGDTVYAKERPMS
jgi:GNAT superfamily N-acetyltransferase